MKAQVLFIVLMAGVLTSDAFAGNTTNDPKQQEAEKKTIKPKYDFNIFKFFSVPTQPVDSLKKEPSPLKKALLLTRKEFAVFPEKKS